MKALAMLENKASRELWATDLRRDAEEAKVLSPTSQLLSRVVGLVSTETGFLKPEIRGKSRIADIARARHLTWLKLTELGVSASAIGRAFHVDHTTVLHGVKSIKSKLGPPNQEAA